jgi:hypothetical protein
MHDTASSELWKHVPLMQAMHGSSTQYDYVGPMRFDIGISQYRSIVSARDASTPYPSVPHSVAVRSSCVMVSDCVMVCLLPACTDEHDSTRSNGQHPKTIKTP